MSNTPQDVTSAEQSFSQEMQLASWHVRYIPVRKRRSLRCLTRQTVRRLTPTGVARATQVVTETRVPRQRSRGAMQRSMMTV